MTTSTNSLLFERLTPDNAVLYLIDVQTGLLFGIQTSSPIELKNNILALASLGKVFGLPTILITSTASRPNGQVMSEIKDMFPDEEVLDRTFVNT